MTLILGLESSCDDSAAALVTSDRRILAQAVVGQNSAHQPYGGVVPEIAARAHVEILPGLIERVLAEAKLSIRDVDAIAACWPRGSTAPAAGTTATRAAAARAAAARAGRRATRAAAGRSAAPATERGAVDVAGEANHRRPLVVGVEEAGLVFRRVAPGKTVIMVGFHGSSLSGKRSWSVWSARS